ncbi:hypothetical protein ACOJBQ_003345 [Cronobacter muytjensii]
MARKALNKKRLLKKVREDVKTRIAKKRERKRGIKKAGSASL